jgi:uncharacterized protein YdhG (YjbR/CyaY superfamily)
MARRRETIDDYLAGIEETKRAALERLRASIRAAAPEARECISYGVPAYRQGRMLVGFGAAANHCTFYLMSSSVLSQFAQELAGYETGKGSIRFTPDKPLPEDLVRRLVQARQAENEALDRRRQARTDDAD